MHLMYKVNLKNCTLRVRKLLSHTYWKIYTINIFALQAMQMQ